MLNDREHVTSEERSVVSSEDYGLWWGREGLVHGQSEKIFYLIDGSCGLPLKSSSLSRALMFNIPELHPPSEHFE